MMMQKLKRPSVAIVSLVFLLLVSLASPASAGYREGRISCQSGYVVFLDSHSGETTWHEHYLESYPKTYTFTSYLFTLWTGPRNYGTWSVKATPLDFGSAGCTPR